MNGWRHLWDGVGAWLHTHVVDVLIPVAILVSAIAAGVLLHAALRFLFFRRHARKPFKVAGLELNLDLWSAPIRALIPAVFFVIALPFAGFHERAAGILHHLAYLWIIAAVAWLCKRTLDVVRDLLLSHYRMDVKDNLRARQVYTHLRILDRVVGVLIVFIAAAAMLMTFGKMKQLGVSLLASAGAVGIVFGFAAQKTLGTLLAGIQIAIAQPIRLEDVVIVENEWGWIEEITLTYVVIRIWDQRRLVVPITYFIEKPFQNWTRTTAELIGSVYIYADYTVPVQALRDEIQRILQGTPLWNKKAWTLQVTNATEHTVELRALMSADDSSTAWNLRCLVREGILDFLQKIFPASLPRTRVVLKEGGEPSSAGRPE